MQIFHKLLGCTLALLAMTGCGKPAASAPHPAAPLTITATLFPQYDFAREIGGDRAAVSLLLPAGVESHSFEPTPADLVTISKSDLFLSTGAVMEPWAATLLAGEDMQAVRSVDLSAGISLASEEHPGEVAHNVDPHIWTSPRNAAKMVETIADAMVEADPEGETLYRENEKNYLAKLSALDTALLELQKTAKRHTLVFGGRFAFRYLTDAYGFTPLTAYDSCAAESEPSVQRLATLVEVIRAEQLPVIFYQEMTDPKVAKTLADETGARLRMLHSAHNLSAEEHAAGATYLSLMEQNLVYLREALS